MMSLKIKLWFSLTAALPFSSDGQHPVFTWTTSLVCGHFLGKLFSDLVLGPEKVNEVDERTESRSESESKTGKIPKARSNERLQNKRQKYLRKLMQRRHINNLSFTEKCRNEYKITFSFTILAKDWEILTFRVKKNDFYYIFW